MSENENDTNDNEIKPYHLQTIEEKNRTKKEFLIGVAISGFFYLFVWLIYIYSKNMALTSIFSLMLLFLLTLIFVKLSGLKLQKAAITFFIFLILPTAAVFLLFGACIFTMAVNK